MQPALGGVFADGPYGCHYVLHPVVCSQVLQSHEKVIGTGILTPTFTTIICTTK